jgi:hypothetical protein
VVIWQNNEGEEAATPSIQIENLIITTSTTLSTTITKHIADYYASNAYLQRHQRHSHLPRVIAQRATDLHCVRITASEIISAISTGCNINPRHSLQLYNMPAKQRISLLAHQQVSKLPSANS